MEEFAEDPLASLLCDCSILVPSSEVQLRSSQDQEGLPGKTQKALVPLLSSLEVDASLLALELRTSTAFLCVLENREFISTIN